jgi:WD40 repeat protein
VWNAAFSPDGRRIVTASWDKTARLWDAETGKPIGEPLKGHEKAVNSAAFSPDGRRILTASEDKTAQLWDADTGKPIGEPLRGHEGKVWSAAFSPDGKRIVTASEDKTARLWDAETGKAPEIFASIQEFVAQAKAEAPRCLTQAQRKKFFLPTGLPHWCIEMEKWPYQTKAWKDWLADTNAGNYPKLPKE